MSALSRCAPGVSSTGGSGRWNGDPAATPPETVKRLNEEVAKAIRLPEIASKLPDFGLEMLAGSPAEFAQSIARQLDRYGKLIKASGAKVD